MAALAADFPEFDAALLAGMVEDQGGDVAEVRAGLRVRPLKPQKPKLRFLIA